MTTLIKKTKNKTNWPTKKLGEVLEYEQPTNYLVSSTDYKDEYPIPVLTAGKSFILGNTNERSGIFPKEKLPVIIFDDFTTAIKFVDFPFKVKSSAMKILHVKKNEADIRFMFYKMLTIKFSHDQHKRYWISECSKLKIPFPPLEVQKQIVERLDKIVEAQKLNDNLIQKSDELFQSLFYNAYELKNNQWDSKKLQEVCEKIEQTHQKKIFKEKFSYIDIASINDEGVIRAQITPVNKAPSRARKVVRTGDTIFSTVRPYLKHIAYIPEMLNNSIASTGFCVIRPNVNLADTLFINYLAESDYFVKKVLPFQRCANYPAVSDKNVYDIKIPLPPLQIQKQIAAKLSAAQDYKTQLLAQKSKLKELFDSALAESMTSEKSRKMPEILIK